MSLAHMKPVVYLLIVSLLGCGSPKKEPQTQAPAADTTKPAAETPSTLDTKGALLQQGLAACLVVFPKPAAPGDWLAMVNLKGDFDTDKLPRIPLAGSNTMTLLNIPPGVYSVSARAWLRKAPPYAGGASDKVILKPGELLILRATQIPPHETNPDNVRLIEAGRKTWTVTSPAQLSEFIAQSASAVRG